MKKIFSIIVLMTLVFTLDAQVVKKSFNVTGFNGVNAGGVFDIELIKSNNENVAIETEASVMEYVKVKVSRGVLVLSLDQSIPSRLQRNMKPIMVVVNIRDFVSLNLSGASRFITDSKFSTEDFKVNLSGASKASGLNINATNLKVVLSGASVFSMEGDAAKIFYDITGAAKVSIKHNCESLKMEGSGAAKIRVEGSAQDAIISYSGAVNATFKGVGSERFRLEMSGASNFNSLDFPVKEMDIRLSGVSNAKVSVTDSISASISGGSNIKYRGNPQIKSVDISSISSFNKIN